MRTAHLCGVVLSLLTAAAGVAGPLDPPAGPIAPTPGPEARIAINALNTPGDADSVFRITEAGSYYLTGNVVVNVATKSGIEIATTHVTIDLNGYSVLCSAPGPFDGITNTDVNPRNLTVMNGSVTGFGGDGVDLTGIGGDGVRVIGVHATSNVGHGIVVVKSGLVEDCTAVINGLNGIWILENGTVRSCQVLGNGQHGIVVGIDSNVGSNSVVEGCSSVGNGLDGIVCLTGASVTNCFASGNGSDGFAIQGMSTVTACTSKENGFHGFNTAAAVGAGGGSGVGRQLFSGCVSARNNGNGFTLISNEGVVERCSATANSGDGIVCGERARIAFNHCVSNGFGAANGANIRIAGSNCHVEGNTVLFADRGIDVDFPANLVIRNTASGNAVNFDIVANNKVGVIVTAPNSGLINGSTGGAGVGSTDPTANVVY